MTFHIKIDRVCSVEEAVEIDKLGASHIGVSLVESPWLVDERSVSLEQAIEIRQSIKNSKYCGMFDLNLNKISVDSLLSMAINCGFDYVQLPARNRPSSDLRERIRAHKIGLIVSEIKADYDTDPSWILLDIISGHRRIGDYFILELNAAMENAWNDIKNRCPEYPDCLQIEEVDQIAKNEPLLISIDYSPDNIVDLLDSMKNIQGINLSLGSLKPNTGMMHAIDYNNIAEAIEIILKYQQRK